MASTAYAETVANISREILSQTHIHLTLPRIILYPNTTQIPEKTCVPSLPKFRKGSFLIHLQRVSSPPTADAVVFISTLRNPY